MKKNIVFTQSGEQVEVYNISEDTILYSLISFAKNDKKNLAFFTSFWVTDKR